MNNQNEWETLYAECDACRKCPLGDTKTNTVFGSGNQNAELMFIGEAPGENEDLQGKPFVGASGRLLDKYLDRGPSSTATKAAKAALAGENQIGDYLYFTSTKSANYDSYSSYQVVGGNCFYKK